MLQLLLRFHTKVKLLIREGYLLMKVRKEIPEWFLGNIERPLVPSGGNNSSRDQMLRTDVFCICFDANTLVWPISLDVCMAVPSFYYDIA